MLSENISSTMTVPITLAISLIICLPFSNASVWSPEELLPQNYNRLQAPRVDHKPVTVEVSLRINQFLEVHEGEETFKINCQFSQEWNDYRILFPKNKTEPIILHSQWREILWRPASYFYNAVDGTDLNLLTSPLYYEVTNNTDVLMSSRMIMKLTCAMNLALYPHDSQHCHVLLESLSDLSRDVKYTWKDFTVVQMTGFHGFHVSNLTHERVLGERGRGYGLKASFTLQRQLGHYLIRVYAPSFMIVITTFIGFWIPVQGYPARTLIVVLPLLALVTQESQINNEMIVSYIVALDVWYMACSFFIFMALVELATAVVYCHYVEDKKEETKMRENTSFSSTTLTNDDSSVIDVPPPTPNGHLKVPRHDGLPINFGRRKSLAEKLFYRRHSYNVDGSDDHHHVHASHVVKQLLLHVYGDIDWRKSPGQRNKIDYCSRIIFPASFILFVICYFVTLTVHSN